MLPSTHTRPVETRRRAGAGRLRKESMRYVLFICTQNAGRSQMAEAFFNSLAPPDLRAESAGQLPGRGGTSRGRRGDGRGRLRPLGRVPKKLTVEMQLHADWASRSPAADRAPTCPRPSKTGTSPDPAGKPSRRFARSVTISARRVEQLLVHHADDIRADRTAHEERLVSLLPRLDREFGGMRTREEIRACAGCGPQPLRRRAGPDPVLTLAERRATACLRADLCTSWPRRKASFVGSPCRGATPLPGTHGRGAPGYRLRGGRTGSETPKGSILALFAGSNLGSNLSRTQQLRGTRPSGHGPIAESHPNPRTGGRAVAGSNPVSPTIDGGCTEQ